MNCHQALPAKQECRTTGTTHPTARRAPANDRSRLYLIGFLLTADREKAEQCAVTGLELSAEDNAAFRDWAHSWARRIVINNALRIVAPHPEAGHHGAVVAGSQGLSAEITSTR